MSRSLGRSIGPAAGVTFGGPAWGYNTPETRAATQGTRVRLLELDQFKAGLKAWP